MSYGSLSSRPISTMLHPYQHSFRAVVSAFFDLHAGILMLKDNGASYSTHHSVEHVFTDA